CRARLPRRRAACEVKQTPTARRADLRASHPPVKNLGDVRRVQYRFGILLPDFLLNEIVDRALAEDLSGGDVTSAAVVAETERALAKAIAHAALTVCGGAVVAR